MRIEAHQQQRAFAVWLRTGRWPVDRLEHKFNPYHDPRDGRFTFAPSGSAWTGVSSERGGRQGAIERRAVPVSAVRSAEPSTTGNTLSGSLNDGVFRPDGTNLLHRVQRGRLPPGFGSNSGAFQDPMTLEQVFPGLRTSPAGSIVAAADGIFNFSGPASETMTTLSRQRVKVLVDQIRAVDPTSASSRSAIR